MTSEPCRAVCVWLARVRFTVAGLLVETRRTLAALSEPERAAAVVLGVTDRAAAVRCVLLRGDSLYTGEERRSGDVRYEREGPSATTAPLFLGYTTTLRPLLP